MLLAPLFLLVLLAGCGKPPNPDGREDISGNVTLNGSPLTGRADIYMHPADGKSDGGAHTQILNGKYLMTGYDGVKPGKYIVRITSLIDFDRSTGELADNTIVFGNEVTVDVVPAEFNKESKIEFEVVSGKNNVFNYDIKTDYVPTMPKKLGKAPPPL